MYKAHRHLHPNQLNVLMHATQCQECAGTVPTYEGKVQAVLCIWLLQHVLQYLQGRLLQNVDLHAITPPSWGDNHVTCRYKAVEPLAC